MVWWDRRRTETEKMILDFGPVNHRQNGKCWERSGEKARLDSDNNMNLSRLIVNLDSPTPFTSSILSSQSEKS